MVPADILILVLILLPAFSGFRRGLIRELVALAIWIGGTVAAVLFQPQASAWLGDTVPYPQVLPIAGFASVFVGVLLAGAVVQWVLGHLVNLAGISGIDRGLGLLFGAGRGVAICVAGVLALRYLLGDVPWSESSILIPVLLGLEDQFLNLLGISTEWLSALPATAAGGEQ